MKIIKTYLTIALLLTIFVSNAQVSKQQADNQIIDIFSIHSNCLIYSTNNSIGPGVNITTADGDSFTNPYNNSYVYFIDEMPSTNWSHQCKYCFLDTITGNYTIYSDDMYPQNYSVFRSISKNNSVSTIPWTGNANYATNPIIPDEHQWAILICSNSGTYINRFWGDLSCVYTTLTSRYGFIENESSDEFLYFNHIIVFAPEEITQSKPADLNNSGGYSNNDFITENNVYSNNKLIMYDKESLQIIFDNLSGNDNSLYRYGYRALDSLDKLFVYVTGHGYKSGNHSYIKLEDNNTTLTDTELADMVKDINCSQMTFLFQPCYCGGFIDDLSNTTNAKCKNRAIQTATSYNRYSHAEKYINHVTSSSWPSRGPDDDNYYVNEFTYYWCSALLGYYPIIRFNQTPIIGPWNTFENNTIGSFPWNMFFNETTLLNHDNVDVAPDIDNDGNVSMDEAYLFARKLDSWDTLGYFNPAEIYDPDGLYAVEYPQSAYESSFTKELITLNGYKGFIDSDAETGIGCRYLLDGYVKVVADASLTINDGCIINGNDHTIDNRGIFTTASGLINATFRNTHLINKASQRFTLSNCVFDTCDFIKTLDSDCSISNSTFNETRFEADTDNPPRDNYCVNLFENTFNNTIDTNSIYIRKTPCCNVIGNYVTSGGNGIYINHLDGSCNNHIFSENIIQNCGKTGFVSYFSNSKLNKNKINTNHIGGIKTLNLSNLYVKGDSTASTMTAQKINNNLRFQIYASSDSYPVDFHFNGIYGSDTLLYYESSSSGNKIRSFDVTKNYWSNLTNNEISSHLFTNGNSSFSYLPTWAPHLPSDPPSPPGRMLSTGDSLVEKGDFSNAMAVYKTLVAAYPESSEAVAALLALFSVDIETNGDFDGLKNYYIGLMNNDYLSDVADKLVNRCDVVLNNFADAIEWYENKISDPNTLYSDRVFAEIDLGDLYIDMAAMGEKSIKGTMAEYIPVSKESHEKRTAYLLSLLPGKEENQILSDIHLVNNSSRLQLTCTPNPANDKITVLFVIDRESNVVFTLLDIFGNDVKHINLDKQCGGNHELSVELSDIPSGMYFCRMESDYGAKDIVKLLINH